MNVTVGIPVYNEEKNIQKLLKSLALQEGIFIEKTIIVNDGSTDKTLAKITELDYHVKTKINIEIINLSVNKGKPHALNLIFKRACSDYLVLLDSDVQLMNTKTLKILLEPFIRERNVGLVCGWFEVEPTRSACADLFKRAFRFSSLLRKEIALKAKDVYGAIGAIMALSRDVYSTLEIPENTIRDDAYVYLWTISKGKKFIFNPKAKVKLITQFNSLKHFLMRYAKGSSVSKELIENFGKNVRRDLSWPPLFTLLPLFVKTLARAPADGICYCALRSTYFLYGRIFNFNISSKWRHSNET